jgi:hypothetical protein
MPVFDSAYQCVRSFAINTFSRLWYIVPRQSHSARCAFMPVIIFSSGGPEGENNHSIIDDGGKHKHEALYSQLRNHSTNRPNSNPSSPNYPIVENIICVLIRFVLNVCFNDTKYSYMQDTSENDWTGYSSTKYTYRHTSLPCVWGEEGGGLSYRRS